MKNTTEIECRICDPNSNCPGGYELELHSQYWRSNNLSDLIIKCHNKPDNCIGGLQTGDKLCKEGYIGALCESCDIENRSGHGNFGNEGNNI